MPSAIDDMQARLPLVIKWLLLGAGAATGWYYGRGSSIPLSYIIGGAAAGFCLVAGIFVGLRLLKAAAIAGVVLLVINYALLIPFGYGDRMPVFVDTGKAALRWLNPAALARRWGKSDEIRPGLRYR